MCERSTCAADDDHLKRYSTESISLANEINQNSDQPNNTPSEQRSCLTTLRKWCGDIHQRMRCHTDKNNQQIELHETVINVVESIRADTMTQSSQRKTHRRDLFPFKRPYRSLKITDKSSVSIACNDKHILLKQKPYLCLFDKQLNMIKEIPSTYDHVHICWSSTLNQFILVTENIIFTLDDTTMTLNQCQIHLNNEKEWSCGACSDTSLYLSTGDMCASLYEYTLRPEIQFIKEWRLFTLYSLYEGILTFTYGDGKLAIIISNIHIFQRRLDLRSSTTLERLWSIPLDAIAHCCSINNDQWIVMELLKPRLLHISSDGKILQVYKVQTSSMNVIWNAIQLDKDTIATFNMNSLNLHKLS